MPQNQSLDDAPDYVIDDFDTAGVTRKGKVHARVVGWEYQPPAAGTTNSPQLRGEFDIFEREGVQGELKEKTWDSFFLDPQSLWKLKNLAVACGKTYEGSVSAKQIAKDVMGMDFFGVIAHREQKTTGRQFPYFSKFGANWSELEGGDQGGAEDVPF